MAPMDSHSPLHTGSLMRERDLQVGCPEKDLAQLFDTDSSDNDDHHPVVSNMKNENENCKY